MIYQINFFIKKFVFALIIFLTFIFPTFGFDRLTPDFTANYVPDSSGVEAGIWMEANESEERVKTSPARINNSELDIYLKEVLCKLTPEFCNEVRIYVVRNPYFNATMAPNGMMQIYTGFLLRVRNEAQLASVLGHEVGHYLKRHSMKYFENASAKASFFAFFMLGIAGAVGTGNMNPDIGRATIDLTSIGLEGSIFAYSRDNEREADKYGVQLLQDAKLDINEAKQIWINLNEEKDEKIYSGAYFYATHPDPEERIKNLEKHAQEISKTRSISSTKNKEKYWQSISTLLPLMYEDELNLRQLNQSEYLLKKHLNDNISPGLVHYYLGELYRLKKDEKQEYLIKRNYEDSLRFDDHPPEVYRALGLIEYKKRNFSVANQHFDSYLNLKPDAHDKEMIEFYKSTGG